MQLRVAADGLQLLAKPLGGPGPGHHWVHITPACESQISPGLGATAAGRGANSHGAWTKLILQHSEGTCRAVKLIWFCYSLSVYNAERFMVWK